MKDIEKRLKDGETLFLVEDDIYAIGEVYYSKAIGGAMMFFIWFNCKIVHSSKGFASCEKKINQLVRDWNLTTEFKTIEE